MGNLGTYRLKFRDLCPHIPYNGHDPKLKKFKIETINFSELIARLTPYFTIPRSEQIRLANCLFHEILTCIREGKQVKVPYFGTFHGQYFAGRVSFNIGLNQYNATPKVIQRCQPILLPSPYSMHVCSPKNAFNDPAWYLSGKRKTGDSGSKILWFRNNLRYHKRGLMLYDNPRQMLGLNGLEYKLRESVGVVFPSETDDKELKHLESLFKEKRYAVDKKVVKRFVLRDTETKANKLWCYYNYLPGKYFVGTDNNFYMTEKENKSGKTRYQILEARIKKNKKKFTDTSHLPDKAPDDLVWDVYEMEQPNDDEIQNNNS